MNETKNPESGAGRTKRFKRTVRPSPSAQTVEIGSILSRDNGRAKSRFKELVKKGIPKDLLEATLLAYANRDDEKLELIPGSTRRHVKKLAADTAELADRIGQANKSPNIDPVKLHFPPDPWHGGVNEIPLHLKFMRLPILLRLYYQHIQFCLERLPRNWFVSDRQEIELISVSMAMYFTGKPQYAATAELLNAALGAADEAQNGSAPGSGLITRAALLQLVKDHPEDVRLAKEQLAELGFPEKKSLR